MEPSRHCAAFLPCFARGSALRTRRSKSWDSNTTLGEAQSTVCESFVTVYSPYCGSTIDASAHSCDRAVIHLLAAHATHFRVAFGRGRYVSVLKASACQGALFRSATHHRRAR